jgi:hypothetical protein
MLTVRSSCTARRPKFVKRVLVVSVVRAVDVVVRTSVVTTRATVAVVDVVEITFVWVDV